MAMVITSTPSAKQQINTDALAYSDDLRDSWSIPSSEDWAKAYGIFAIEIFKHISGQSEDIACLSRRCDMMATRLIAAYLRERHSADQAPGTADDNSF